MLRTFTVGDAEPLSRIQQVAFGVPAEDTTRWWNLAGRENLQVFEQDGNVVAGLVDIPMGIWAQGRSVPLHGVAGVAVAPEARGRGVAKRMMTAYLEQLAAKGIALSALYASTRALYQGVGYGIAGQHFTHTMHPDALRQAGRRDGQWRLLTEDDREGIAALRATVVCHQTGSLDRGPYVWNRVWKRGELSKDAWLLEGESGVAAWVVMKNGPKLEGWTSLEIADYGVTDALSLQRLIGFLSTFGAMARKLTLTGGPHDALVDSLPEYRVTQTVREPFLLRIVSLSAALTQRGWPKGFSGAFDLEVEDAILADNRGRWQVRIADGVGTVERGGSGSVSIGERGLAALFLGYSTPWTLRTRGLLDGEHLEALAGAFAGPAPGMADFF